MRFGVLASALLLAACATATSEDTTQPRQTRELSNKEKEALRVTLNRQKWIFPNDNTQFKWVPVVYVPGKPETDYCGLVSETTIFGEPGEYQVFHAVLSQTNGEFLQGRITRTKTSGGGTPNQLLAQSIGNGMVDGTCQKAGYVDFSKAH